MSVQLIEDDDIPFNWTINTPHNSPDRYCEIALETILIGMQRMIYLKKLGAAFGCAASWQSLEPVRRLTYRVVDEAGGA